MAEDFGFGGDEFLIGDCRDDHFSMDTLDFQADVQAEKDEVWQEMWAESENDCPLDGDAESALASCGWGTDEDYGFYGGGEDW